MTVVEPTVAPKYAVGTVTKIVKSADGTVDRTVLAAPKKKRVSKKYRKADRFLRRLARAQRTASDEYLQRHEKSGGKKKNGGLRKAPKNLVKASRKGIKKLKLF